jgi:light-regulated signal transduction histidine kinase (bacteriophytochrome)
MAAHDLRNDQYIQMTSDFLLEPTNADMGREIFEHFLRDINSQARHMLQLLNELLDVTQIEAGKLVIDAHPIDMNEFLSDAVRRHSALAAPKNTTIVLEDVPPASLLADPPRLRQVIDNLISNAVKYSPTGRTVRVRGALDPPADQRPGSGPASSLRTATAVQGVRQTLRAPHRGESSTGLAWRSRAASWKHTRPIGVDSEPGEARRSGSRCRDRQRQC